jgi:hypothetical protein
MNSLAIRALFFKPTCEPSVPARNASPHFSHYRPFIDDPRTGCVLAYAGADGRFAAILGMPVLPIAGYWLHRPSPNCQATRRVIIPR